MGMFARSRADTNARSAESPLRRGGISHTRRHPKAAQLRAWAAGIGVAPNDVLFVGDAVRDAAIARAAGVRFVGLSRPGHSDAFAGSGVPVVTSLTDLARLVARARRSPVTVTVPAGKVGPSAPEPLAALATAPFEGGRPRWPAPGGARRRGRVPS